MKRILLSIFCLHIVILVFAANYDFAQNGIYYKKETNNAVYVTGAESSSSITIPNSVIYKNREYFVKGIGDDAFRGCSNLTSISIHDGVIRIGWSAFQGCTGLTSIEFPNTLMSIGDCAFAHCSGLTSITIGKFVSSIGNDAFSGCSNLRSMVVEDGNSEYDSRGNCNAIIETANNKLIAGCKTTIIPNSVTSIGKNAFHICTGLTFVTIPNSVTSIGESAFSECTGLTSITIPNSVTSIGEEAFYGCTGLKSITIPRGVTSIGKRAFSVCTGLTSITIPNSVTSIGNEAFYGCTGLKSITIPRGVTSIGSSAFQGCTGLTSVVSEIIKPFTFGFKAFSNIGTTCALSIPSGTKDAYIAAGWTESIFGGGILEGGVASGTCGDNLTWTYVVSTGTLTITGRGKMNDYSSLSSVPWYKYSSSISKVIIGESVTSIGQNAFVDCYGLTSITIPNSVTSIGNNAFQYCTGLTSVTIPNSVTSIGNSAFVDCYGLTSITIPNSVTSIGSSAFQGCTGLIEPVYNSNCFAYMPPKYQGEYTIPDGIVYICGGAFYECTGLTSITIPNSLTSIGGVAFYECTGLTSIEIPNSVTSIGEDAFSGCTSITYLSLDCETIGNWFSDSKTKIKIVVLGENVKSIGENAFNGFSSLTSISISNSVTSIGASAFSGCTGLTSVTIPNSVTSIGNSAFFGCYGLKSIKIPNSVTSIGQNAFCRCYGLTSITIPNSVTSIGDETFLGCDRLKSISLDCSNIGSWFSANKYIKEITLGEHVKSIEKGAFSGCTGLISVTIPNSVTSIGSSAFSGCSSLTSVTIPNGVTSIGESAFSGCTGLKSIVSEIEEPFAFGSDAFNNIGTTCTLTVPYGTKDAYIAAGWTESIFGGGILEGGAVSGTCGDNLTWIYVKAKGALIITGSGEMCNYSFESKSPWARYRVSVVDIKQGVMSIGNYAFYGCTDLTSIEIPNSVTSIGESAFSGCTGLSSITIPNSVTSIGSGAFIGCTGLTSIEIPNSVTSIGSGAFSGCTGLTSLSIPNSITSIALFAFYNCISLTSVVSEIEEPFYFDPGAFDNIGTTCTLTVPYGTRDAYIAKGWTEDVFKGGIVEAEASDPDSPNIIFADANVKALCVANWDTNGDGKLSKAEAAAVTDLGEVFKGNTEITSFNELQYFTKLTIIGAYAFHNCSNLKSLTIPNSVISIGQDAFSACSSITSIDVSKSNPVYDSRDNCNAIIETATNQLIKGCQNTIIPNSVTSIGFAAFSGCTGLTSITIPNSVTSIGSWAFYDCTGLTSVVSEIEKPFAFGPNAFLNISSSCTLTVPKGTKEAYIASGWTEDIFKGGIVEAETFNPDSPNIIFADAHVKALCVANWDTNGDGELSKAEAAAVTDLGEVFKGNTKITSFNELQYFTGLSTIGSDSFGWCYGLTSLSIPNSVTSIGGYAFYACTGLTSITIPNSVTSIGDYAFYGCTGLTSITIPNSVTSIGDSAFRNCSGLTSVTVGNSVTSIAVMAFCDCRNLTSIIIPNSVTSIGAMAFWNTAWYSNQPDGLVYAGLVAYKYKGTMPDNTKIQLRSNTIGIGQSAFYNCTGLTSIEIPNSVTSIGSSAFNGCTGLTSLSIPNSITSIAFYAFDNCISLTSVVSEIEEPFYFDPGAFDNIGTTCTLTVPYGTRDAYIAAGWTEDIFKGGIVEEEQTDPNILTIADLDIVETVQVKYITEVGSSYEGGKAEFNIASVLSKLPAGDVKIYAVQSNGTLDANYESGPYDGWHNADGDWERWGTSATAFCVKADFTLQKDPIYYIAGYSEGTHLTRAINYSVKYAFVGPNNEAIILNVIIAYINYKIGDVNGDGRVSVTDVVMMISHILQKNPVGFNKDAADMNGDGRISVTDVTIAIAKVLRVK